MTYLYLVLGEALYRYLFPGELIITFLHVASFFNLIPMGRKFSKPLVRMNFGIELLILHLCFWTLDYGNSFAYYMMAIHYWFHVASNLGTIFIKLDDFSEPFEGSKELARKLVIPWDSACHIYNVYCLTQVLGTVHTFNLSLLALIFLFFFPKENIYAHPISHPKVKIEKNEQGYKIRIYQDSTFHNLEVQVNAPERVKLSKLN